MKLETKYNFIIEGDTIIFSEIKDLIINKNNKHLFSIIEGVVSDEVALKNKKELQRIIDLAKAQNKKLIINDIDAFYNITETTKRHSLDNSIRLPNDFNLELGDNFTARVQPNGNDGYMFFGIGEVDNVTVKGGTIIGDRYKHNYSSGIGSVTHDWGHLIDIRAAHNITINNVTLMQGSGDGVHIAGREHRNIDGGLKPTGKESYNVTIKNCLIDGNRRNNISVTDGTNIFIEYNTITSAGSGTGDTSVISSNGISPRAGIDVEAYKKNAGDGNSNYHYERCENIYIKYNNMSYNYSGDVILFNGELSYVENNNLNSKVGVSTSYGFNNRVANNIIENKSGEFSDSKGIEVRGVKWEDGSERHTDWLLDENEINGYHFGIISTGKNHIVRNNELKNNKYSIRLGRNDNCTYYNNTIESDLSSSTGYSTSGGEINIIKTSITNGILNTNHAELSFLYLNNKTEGDLLIEDLTINVGRFDNAQGVTLKNSVYEKLKVKNSNLIEIK